MCAWALAFSFCRALPALADTADPLPRALFFASSDVRAREMFGHSGFKLTPFQPLEESGFVLQGMMTSGLKTYFSGRLGGTIQKNLSSASLIGGYQLARDDYFLTLMAGFEWVNRSASAVDPDDGNRLGARLGLRLQADLWLRPGPDSLLIVTALVGTASDAIWVRVAPGYRVMGDLFAGPEVAASSEFGEATGRAGLHLTGLQWLGLWLSVSAGAAFTKDGRTGPYGALSMVRKF